MANTAFGHDATLTTPGSTTNTALVRWANTSGSSLGNTANILSDGSNITLNARGEVRFADADSSHYIALEAPATVSTTYTMALPAAVPSANDYLKVTSYSGGAGVLEWATASGGASINAGTENELVTVANTVTNLEGESELTYDGTDFKLMKGGAAATGASLAIETYNDGGNPARLRLRASHNDTQGTMTNNINDYPLGFIQFEGAQEGAFQRSAVIRAETAEAWDANGRGSKMSFWTTPNNTNTETLVMTIENDGKVGIGTASPEVPFHVQKGDSSLAPGTGTVAFFESDDAECYINLHGASDATGGIRFGNTGNVNTACQLLMHPGQLDVRFGSTLTFRIASGGNVTGTHGTYHTSSDLRTKENIVNSDVGLDTVMQMRSVKFNFLENRRLGTQTRLGFIAQEIESLVPEVVHTADAPDDDIPDMKAIEDMQLLPILVKAIQELNAKIDALGS